MQIENVFEDLPLPYREHFLFAVEYYGFYDARFNERGNLTGCDSNLLDGPRFNLLRREDSLNAALEALILADLLSGATVGGDRLKDFANDVRVEGLERRRAALFPVHREFLALAMLSHEFVAQRLRAQLEREK